MASRKRGNKARARAAGEGTEGRANDKRDAAQTSTSENAVTPLQVRRARAAPSALLSTNQCQATRYRPLWRHQVALYWPNIIGYYRFVLLLAAMAAHVVGRPGFCIIAWFTSCALDFFDGIAARAFNQVWVAGCGQSTLHKLMAASHTTVHVKYVCVCAPSVLQVWGVAGCHTRQVHTQTPLLHCTQTDQHAHHNCSMSRTLLWLLVIPGMPIAIPVISLIVTIEWLTMASTHAE